MGDGAGRYVDRVGDLLHGGVFVAVFADQGRGRIDQLRPRHLLFAFPKSLLFRLLPHGP